jgi:DNA-binding HxlR family transcriptional regulator
VARPGELERSAPGLTAKVLADRLAKLVRYGVLARTAFPEVPPRVEYALTDYGRRLMAALDQVSAAADPATPPG